MGNQTSAAVLSGWDVAAVTRRQLLAGAGTAAGLAMATRLPLPAQETGEITVYSGRNEDLIGPVLTMFSDATGIKVNARYGSTAEMAATILEEGGNSPADVFLAQDAGALGAVEDADQFSALPQAVLDIVDPRYRSEDGEWVGLTARARVLVYNTDQLVEEDLPGSVENLTGEVWMDNVGWAPTNGSFQSFVTAFREVKGDDAAEEWLRDMLDNGAVTFEGNSDIVRAVAAGEITTGLVNHYYVYEIQAEEGTLSVANHFFDDGDIGSLVNVSGIGMLKTAGNPEGAQQLIEYLLGEEAQTYFAETTFEYPLLGGIPTAEELIPLAEIQGPDIDLSDLDDLEETLELLAEVGLV